MSRSREERLLVLGDAAVRVVWDDGEVGALANRLFGDVPGREAGGQPLMLRIGAGGDGEGYRLTRDGDEVWRGGGLGALAAKLLDVVLHGLADHAVAGMMLHAAGVVRAGRAVLIPAASGKGKTSLCAWLVRQGWGYLTDELVFVAEGTLRACCFPRPLNVKKRGAGVVLELIHGDEADDMVRTPFGILVPHRRLNPSFSYADPDIGAVLAVRFHAGSPLELAEMPKRMVARQLMECMVNGEELPGHGFSEATRIARDVPGLFLRYGAYEQLTALGPALERLLAQDP